MIKKILIGFVLFGCNNPQVPAAGQPCDPNNGYQTQCGDGTCCDHPGICWGPDSEGFYCEAPWYNPDDPGNFYSAKPKKRAHR